MLEDYQTKQKIQINGDKRLRRSSFIHFSLLVLDVYLALMWQGIRPGFIFIICAPFIWIHWYVRDTLIKLEIQDALQEVPYISSLVVNGRHITYHASLIDLIYLFDLDDTYTTIDSYTVYSVSCKLRFSFNELSQLEVITLYCAESKCQELYRKLTASQHKVILFDDNSICVYL